MQGGVADAGSPRYEVSIRYYTVSPVGKDSSWRDANAMSCDSGGGLAATPKYALLQSNGRTGLTSRTMEAVYDFAVVPSRPKGGLLPLRGPGSTHCLTATGSAGSRPVMTPCDPADAQQLWSYRPDLTLALSATIGTAQPLCIDAANGVTGGVYLQACDPDAWMRQAWAYNDNGFYELPTATGGLSAWCMVLASADVTTQPDLVASDWCSGPWETEMSVVWDSGRWEPGRTVGPGAAGTTSGELDEFGQLVNLDHFGRCFDITNFQYDWAFMIVYQCKQAVDRNLVGWNQRFVRTVKSNGTSLLSTTSDTGETRCITAGDGVNAPTDGARITMRPCSSSNIYQEWTFTGVAETYAKSYTIRSYGMCLGHAVTPESDAEYDGIAEPQIQACDGSNRQKWNAPMEVAIPGLHDLREVTP